MIKLKNTILILILTFANISQATKKLDHKILPNNKVLMIKPGMKYIYLARYDLQIRDNKKVLVCDGTFKIAQIPMLGNACEFKIIVLNSQDIIIFNTQMGLMVLFDKNGNLIKDVEIVKNVFSEVNLNLNRSDASSSTESVTDSEPEIININEQYFTDSDSEWHSV